MQKYQSKQNGVRIGTRDLEALLKGHDDAMMMRRGARWRTMRGASHMLIMILRCDAGVCPRPSAIVFE